mmetsp:Transcript_4808/g.12056  ORF Transcript_4808/g.12056 Transcript_4808/m.12056 type:complete len:94 (+) Transcript_4808:67-348(+)
MPLHRWQENTQELDTPELTSSCKSARVRARRAASATLDTNDLRRSRLQAIRWTHAKKVSPLNKQRRLDEKASSAKGAIRDHDRMDENVRERAG